MKTSQKTNQARRSMKIFSFCVNKLWLLFASIIIIIALLYILLGFLLPKIDRYQTEIIDWVENQYQVNLEVDKISAEWSAQGPVVKLNNFRIKSDDGSYNLLQVEKISLYFDVITSIWDWRFSTQDIAIDKADLTFFINRKLGVALNRDQGDLEPIDLETSSHQLFNALFGQRKITLTNSSLKLYTLAGTEFAYYIDKLEVRKFENVHQLSGQLKYGDDGQITLVTEVYGDPSLENSYSEIYLNGSGVDIVNLPWLDAFELPAPKSGNLSWQFWGTWKERHWQQASVLLGLQNASWSNVDSTTTEKLNQKSSKNNLAVMLSWRHEDIKEGYLSVHNFKIETPESKETLLPQFFVKFQREDIVQASWDLVLNNFQIAPLTTYIGHLVDRESELSKFLTNADFSLMVERLNLTVFKRADLWQSPIIDFKFSSLEYKPWNNLPRANGLSGFGLIRNEKGQLQIDADNIELEFGNLFRHSIKVTTLHSNLNWFNDSDSQLVVNINSFELSNPDLTVNARAIYFQQDEQPVLSLYTELANVNATNKSLYLPVGVMTKSLVNYLDDGVKSGNFPLIKSVLRGPIKEFPFSNNNGLFVALGFLKNATYQYLPVWPVATGLDADLLFEGNRMDIVINKGSSMKNTIVSAHATANDLSIANSILKLKLDVISRDNSARNLLQETPISFISDSLNTIDFSGKLRTKISLKIGLSDSKGSLPEVKGHIELRAKTSKITTPLITLENIEGDLKFDESGVLPSNLVASYRGKKMSIGLLGKSSKESAGLTLDIKGILPAEGISDFLSEDWAKYFEGETPFSSSIEFGPADNSTATRVLFLSEMQGMKMKLPGELGKTNRDVADMYLSLDIDKVSTGELKWKGLSGNWYWNQGSNHKDPNHKDSNHKEPRGEVVNYGGDFFLNISQEQPSTRRPGIRVLGEMKSVKLADWLTFIETLQERGNDSAKNVEASSDLFFESIALNIEELDAYLVNITNIKLNLIKPVKLPWSLELSSEQADLSLVLNTDKPWEATLDNVNIQLAEHLFEEENSEKKEAEKNQLEEKILSPMDFVDADIRCSGCIIQGKDYGDFLIQLRQKDKGVNFSGLINKGKQHRLSMFGNWQVNELSNNLTNIQFELQTNDAGKLLKKWDVDLAIEDSSAYLVGELSWQDTPWLIDYSKIEGGLRLNLGKGYLSEISDEKGRIFSLFNLQSIIRKLTFDFKDVYKKGFFYNSIRGTFEMKDGVISTENVRIDGNVADVKIYGQTDITNEKIEQLAVITPHLTSSLPILAAWAIEPTTGIIVYLLNKLMEPAVEVATRIDYRIHGSFDDVKVDEVETSKKKIKIEYESEVVPETEIKKDSQDLHTVDKTDNQDKIKKEKIQVIDKENSSEKETTKKVNSENSIPL